MTGEFNISTLDPVDAITDALQFIVYDPDSTDTVKHKKATEVDLISYLESNIVFTDGLRLNENRIFAQEKTTTFAESTTGWVTIAETDSDTTAESFTGFCSIITGGGYSGTCEFNIRLGAASDVWTFKNVGFGDISEFGTNIGGFRVVYGDADTDGLKLQVYLITETAITACLYGHTARGSLNGLYLVTATTTDNDVPPSGATASYLVAGSVLPFVASGTFMDNRIIGYNASETSLRITIYFNEIIYPNASTITFPVATNLRSTQDSSIVYTISAGETMAVDMIKGKTVTAVITTTGLTAEVMSHSVGANVSAELS